MHLTGAFDAKTVFSILAPKRVVYFCLWLSRGLNLGGDQGACGQGPHHDFLQAMPGAVRAFPVPLAGGLFCQLKEAEGRQRKELCA